MSKFGFLRRILIPAVALGIALPGLTTGCDELAEAQSSLCCSDFYAGADLSDIDFEADVTFDAFIQGTADFTGVTTGIVTDLATTCKALAVDLGADSSADAPVDGGDAVTFWCGQALAQVKAEITAKGSITLEIQPPQCNVNFDFQASCEGGCSVDGGCDPGSVEARCDPGKIAGKCEGGCSGSCSGSANLAVACEGSCEGTCTGTCDGTCSNEMGAGNCNGSCSGTCNGECRGTCAVEAGAEVECSGSCQGGCDVELKAPKCTVKVDPPSCDLDVDCQASCEANASAKAECTPPSVEIVATGDISVQAIGALKLHLPQFALIVETRLAQLQASADAMVKVSLNLDPGGLSVKAAACLIPAGAAIEAALANLEASISATVNLSNELGM